MRPRQHVFIFGAVALLAFGANAFGQVRAGLSELNFSGAITSAKPEGGTTTTAATLTGAYGFFATRAIEVGPKFNMFKVEGDDGFGTISGFGAYHFGASTSRVVPFVAAQIGRSFGMATSSRENPWSFGFSGGVKAFVRGGSGAITIEPFWNRQFTRNKILDTRPHLDTFGVSAGVSIFF